MKNCRSRKKRSRRPQRLTDDCKDRKSCLIASPYTGREPEIAMEDKMRVSITATTNLGAGVARTPDGIVIFVAGAVEGDVADVVITRSRASYYEGRIERLIIPSQHRISPNCTSFDEGCGGCTFRHVTYAHELKVKSDYIASVMKKNGINIVPEPFLTAGENTVRSKVTVPVGMGRSGYYERSSHNIVCSDRCLLHDGETDMIRVRLAAMNVPWLCQITVRRSTDGMMLILRADDVCNDVRRAAMLAADEFPFLTSVYVCADGKYHHIAKDTAIYDSLAGCRFKISPDSFYQVNHAGAELLYARAIRAAGLTPGERVADLYCGTGTIGIAAAKQTDVRLTGIEINKAAVADAMENAAANGVHADFICGDAASYSGTADCVIVDPPRAGCDRRLLSHLCRMMPSRVVYVSCDPATLARDAAFLSKSGYAVRSVTPVDMFPRTSHVECVVLMTKVQK